MPQANCPTLSNYIAGEDCLENLAGLGEVVYIGLKEDLKNPMTATDNVYSCPEFKDGKGLYKFELKEESQKVASESQGKRKGFKLTGTMVFDAVNRKTSLLSRGLNNLDWFAIFPDGEDNQIVYDPNKKVRVESGGLKSDTGAAASDERTTQCEFSLGPVKYDNLFVEAPGNDKTWDDLVIE